MMREVDPRPFAAAHNDAALVADVPPTLLGGAPEQAGAAQRDLARVGIDGHRRRHRHEYASADARPAPRHRAGSGEGSMSGVLSRLFPARPKASPEQARQRKNKARSCWTSGRAPSGGPGTRPEPAIPLRLPAHQ